MEVGGDIDLVRRVKWEAHSHDDDGYNLANNGSDNLLSFWHATFIIRVLLWWSLWGSLLVSASQQARVKGNTHNMHAPQDSALSTQDSDTINASPARALSPQGSKQKNQ
eukprot:792426-Amphidinium_carterae.1